MASTSLFGKAIEYEPGEHAANEAVDTLQARIIANNVAHLADASSQVLVACPPGTNGDGWATTFPASGPGLVLLAQWGPFFARTRGNGRAYSVRYRVHGRTDKAGNGAEIFVWLHPFGRVSPANALSAVAAFESTAGNEAVQLHTATSTTAGWVAPDSGNPVVRVSVADTNAARVPLSIRDEIGGSPATVVPPRLGLTVLARRASGSSATSAELTGFYAAEVFA